MARLKIKKCPKCGAGVTRLRSHFDREHDVTLRQWILDNEHDGVHPTCACGCGRQTTWQSDAARFATWIKDHYSSSTDRKCGKQRQLPPGDWNGDNGTTCLARHAKHRLPCFQHECRQWIDCQAHCNCTMIAVADNDCQEYTYEYIGDIYGDSRTATHGRVLKYVRKFKSLVSEPKVE